MARIKDSTKTVVPSHWEGRLEQECNPAAVWYSNIHVRARRTYGRKNCIKGEKEETIMSRSKMEGNIETSNKRGGKK
jgi:hypothetical protein